MNTARETSKKVIAIMLSILLVITMIPTLAIPAFAATPTDTRVTDPSTMDGWKQYFGENVDSTLNAGAIWTDKSVFTGKEDSSVIGEFTNHGISIDQTTNTNFLVALSALASNKEIIGYSNIPTDTILVLDLSNSMSDRMLEIW